MVLARMASRFGGRSVMGIGACALMLVVAWAAGQAAEAKPPQVLEPLPDRYKIRPGDMIGTVLQRFRKCGIALKYEDLCTNDTFKDEASFYEFRCIFGNPGVDMQSTYAVGKDWSREDQLDIVAADLFQKLGWSGYAKIREVAVARGDVTGFPDLIERRKENVELARKWALRVAKDAGKVKTEAEFWAATRRGEITPVYPTDPDERNVLEVIHYKFQGVEYIELPAGKYLHLGYRRTPEKPCPDLQRDD
ncbi:MAG: hypothetical protein ACLPIX_21700 [Rhodomicrobium sp.]